MAEEQNILLDSQEEYQKQVEKDLSSIRSAISKNELEEARAERQIRLQSWHKAEEMVKEFQPVPFAVWEIVRGVFGREEEARTVEPAMFSLMDRLLYQAALDGELSAGIPGKSNKKEIRLHEALSFIGSDVAAALCLIHGICRRIVTGLEERIWRALLDDALLRAKIGYHVGGLSKPFGRGKGMLAGFSGRSGLAIQLVCGDTETAQKVLEELASGNNIRNIGLEAYGCEPLQVSALALSASGCNREAAFGTASFALDRDDVEPGSEHFRWLSAFTITEHLRMGSPQNIEERYWNAMDVSSEEQKEILSDQVRVLLRRGHNWTWFTWPQSEMIRQS